MNTDAINHDPAITFIQSGSQQPGRPSMGAWVSYGLGSENQNLPAFVVMLSQAQALNPDQPLFSRLWGSGFLPSNHQGVRFRAGSNPVLYLHNPEGIDPGTRRDMLDAAGKLNRMHLRSVRRSGNRNPHLAVRDGVPHADLGAGPAGSFERAAEHLRPVRPGRAQAGHLRRELPAGAPPAGARRALRPALPSRLGPAQRSAARSRPAVQRHGPARRPRWSWTSSSAACSTTRW